MIVEIDTIIAAAEEAPEEGELADDDKAGDEGEMA